MISGFSSNDIHVYVQLALIISACYIFLISTSGKVLKFVLSHVSSNQQYNVIPSDPQVKDTGFIVGKCENLLIPTLILLNGYTALAIIFTAKTIVRAEDMKSNNTLYFLAGTMVNFTYSLCVGVIMKAVVHIYF